MTALNDILLSTVSLETTYNFAFVHLSQSMLFPKKCTVVGPLRLRTVLSVAMKRQQISAYRKDFHPIHTHEEYAEPRNES